MKRILILVVALALVVPSAAFGASPTCKAYNPQDCGTTTQGTTTEAEGTTAAPVATESQGTLPFTGLDVALLALGGGTLLGAGFVVRRLSSSRQN